MPRFLAALVYVALASPCLEQNARPVHSNDQSYLIRILGFEVQPDGDMPGGWRGGPPGTIFVDDKIVHSGHWSARIERHVDSAAAFTSITNAIPMDFAGSSIEF
jgi:hypothetical protein